MKRLVFSPYSTLFSKKYEKIKQKIVKSTGTKFDIHHVGSTSVKGLSGKGIIDILIGINSWKESKLIVNKLRKLGFTHVHPKENGRLFLSNIKETKFSDTHIHIIRKNTKQYRNFLGFRDLLRKNKRIREKYNSTKKILLKETRGDRKKYRQLKGKFIISVLKSINKNS